ncbi:MAG: hypothetical protein ACLUD7_05425 [Lachnospiraceae bacterium]
MQEKIIEALHFYGIKDEEYKKRCLEVVYDINNNEVLKNKVEELFYKLYDKNKEGLSKLWKMKKVSELFGDCNLFITSVMILLGYDIHRKNMSKYNLSDEQKSIHIKRVKNALLDDIYIRGYESVRISQMLWASYFINLRIIEVGGFQYELASENPITKEKEECIKMHVPKGASLKEEDVRSSIRKSTYEIERYFNVKDINYYIESWLLSPEVLALLDDNSNILKFSKLFSIKSMGECTRDILDFVFNDVYIKDYNLLVCKTSLQVKLKSLLINKKEIHIGIGKLKQVDQI